MRNENSLRGLLINVAWANPLPFDTIVTYDNIALAIASA